VHSNSKNRGFSCVGTGVFLSSPEVLSSGLIGAQIRLKLKIWYVRVGSIPGCLHVVRGIPAETPVCVHVYVRPVFLITRETPAGGLLLIWTVKRSGTHRREVYLFFGVC
jgi:hypothetical protein